MILDPRNLSSYPAYELLEAAARGTVGIDQRWLHALVDDPHKTLPDLIRFAAEDHSNDRVPLEVDLVSIFHYLRNPLAIPYLLDVIRAEPSDIPDELVMALAAIGQPAVEPLLKLYEELGPDEGAEVAFLLAGVGIRDPRILDLLLKRLDVDWDDALFHLEVYHDPAALTALERRLEATAVDEERLDLSDTIRDLKAPRPETQIPEFDIWELYPAESDPEYHLLTEAERIEFLSSPLAEQRAAAADVFFGQEFSADATAKLLELARHDADPEVRGAGWAAFFDLTGEPAVRRAMLARLADPETPNLERAGLVLGLARHTDQPEVRGAILQLAEYPETRAKALEAMWRSFDDSFGAAAVKYVEDPDERVRRNAIWAIGYLQQTKDAGLLRQFFEDESLRADALHNYALAVPGSNSRPKLLDLLARIDDLAGGLSHEEADLVKAGLDARRELAGLKPIFQDAQEELEPETVVSSAKAGRNDPCPCGSGKKYKKCCGQ